MKTFITKKTESKSNIEELKNFIIDRIVEPRFNKARQTEEYEEKKNNILEFFPEDEINRASTLNSQGENSKKHQRRGIKHETIEKCKIKKTIKICEFKKEVF